MSFRQGRGRDPGRLNWQDTIPEYEANEKHRLRGYQSKSGPAEPRRNPLAFRPMNDGQERLAESASPDPCADSEDLEKQGFAEKAAKNYQL